MSKKTVEKVYEPKIGDVVAFHGNGTFQACYAIVVGEKFFKEHVGAKMKEIFDWFSCTNDDKSPIFILRINNGTNEFGRSVFVPAFLFLDCYEFKFTFLYSVFDSATSKFAETMLDSFDTVLVVENNRGRSTYYHIVESLKNISKDLNTETVNPKTLYGKLIAHLQEH